MDAFWSHMLTVKLGITTIDVEIRFETLMGNEHSNEQNYRIWLSYCQNPTFLYSIVLSGKTHESVKIHGSNFPSLLHRLIENCLGESKTTQIDLVNEDPDLLSLVVRETQSSRSSNEMSWFGCRLNMATESQIRSYLLSMITNLKKERDEEKWKSIQKDVVIEQLTHLKSIQEEQIKNFQRVFDQILPNGQVNHMDIQEGLRQASSQIGQIPGDSSLPHAPVIELQNSSISPISPSLSSMSEKILSITEAHSKMQFSAASPNPISKPKLSTSNFTETNEDLLLGIASYLFCALCPHEQVTLPNSDEMRKHFIDAHVDDEKLQCRACPDTDVVNGADLFSHMKIHMNRIYACRFCGKKGRKHFLKSHIRIHTGERPYQCQVCTRSFADQSTFRRHQAIHTGLKKYSCPICGRIMSRKDNVKVHLRSHHNVLDDAQMPAQETSPTIETCSEKVIPKIEIDEQ